MLKKKILRIEVNMKLLAFLLIITEIFILFILVADGYQDHRGDGGNHQPPPLFAPHANKQQDSISSLRHQQLEKLDQVIRVSGIEIVATTTTTTKTTVKEKPNASLDSPHHPRIVSYSSPYPSPPLSSELPKNKAETLDRYHHSSKLLEDVNALVGGDGSKVAGRESNPLIERNTTLRRNKRQADNEEASLASAAGLATMGLEPPIVVDSADLVGDSGDELNNDEKVNEPKLPSEYRVYLPKLHKHHHHHHRRRQQYHSHQNIRPHFSVENHEGESKRRFGNKNGHCHRDCSSSDVVVGLNRRDSDGSSGSGGSNNGINGEKTEQQQLLDSYKICGSDGRFYGSICELRRHSCLQDIDLSIKPRAFCLQQQQQQQQLGSPKIEAIGLNGMSNHRNGSEEVRIVELRRRCNSFAYSEMKALLVREFNGDLGSMFKHFDSNGDNYIEAHELWPKLENESNKLRYAQVWDEHSNKCRYNNNQDGDAYLRLNHLMEEDPTKCLFFLDFAFQPQFASNPCSLSHLMLFDLKHPNNRFNLDSFQRAFKEARSSWIHENARGNLNLSISQEPIRRRTRVQIALGDSISLSCMSNFTGLELVEANQADIGDRLISNDDDGLRCLWTRYDLNLGAIQDPHVHIEKQRIREKNEGGKRFTDLTLRLKDAQLYLSGHFKCSCHNKKIQRTFEQIYSVQVSAEPRINVRPKFQWSLPASRISFECHYDYIDTREEDSEDKTRDGQVAHSSQTDAANEDDGKLEQMDERGQFGLRVKWLKDGELVVDNKKFNGFNQSQPRYLADNNNGEATIVSSEVGESDGLDDDEDSFYSAAANGGQNRNARDTFLTIGDSANNKSHRHEQEPQFSAFPEQLSPSPRLSNSSRHASITMAASRLTLENLTLSDSGRHTCRVEVPNHPGGQISGVGENFRVHLNHHLNNDENPRASPIGISGQSDGTLLVQEQLKSDQSSANEIYGTYLWMFHDNGISIYRLQNDDGQEMELLREINGHSLVSGEVDGNWNQLTLCGGLNPEQVVICEWSDNALRIEVKHNENSRARKYIYVGQPNLNRIIVMDGLKFEIVAIINTEPQPRKLYLYEPSKIHLSKWVRRRLSPAANARWLDAIGTHAHSLKSTPDSRLYSMAASSRSKAKFLTKQQQRLTDSSRERRSSMTNQRPSPLIQHDIWLLCYGQPLVLDPSGDEHLEEANRFYSTFGETLQQSSVNTTNSTGHKQRSNVNSVQPFTPRLTARAPFGWPGWPNKESKLRNRKSVHIVQSTFFPISTLAHDSLHNQVETSGGEEVVEANSRRSRNETVVGEFKRSTVLTTHHVFSGISAALSAKSKLYLARPQFDLIQDLYVPPKPYSLESNDRHKIHYAYVTHYDDRRLFRVSMDEYRYDKEIDLQNCDPINLVVTAQGLLVIQCRTPIAHNLIGQLVLDQLTSSRIEFNTNIRAQESYLSPDHRYLVSIFNNTTLPLSTTSSANQINEAHVKQRKRSTAQRESNEMKRQSIIYVQLVTMSGLRLQYEIKTSLEISQCSFVWKDGYYAAIFVSTNRRDDQTEILSLRLADSRLQLMARVPGLISVARHKDQLIVSPELRLAALSTNQGSYVVDLEDNRVSQSLHHHQSPPTLLWV